MSIESPSEFPEKIESVEIPTENKPTFNLNGIKVPAGNGIKWISDGWSIFKKNPTTWMGISIGFILIIGILAMIPFVNFFINILVPVFIAGMMMGFKTQEESGTPTFGHLFQGFSLYRKELITLGFLYLAAIIGAVLITMAVGLLMGFSAAGGVGSSMIVVFLVAFLLITPLSMAIWYAPALIVFHQVTPMDALKSGCLIAFKNWSAFLFYSLIVLILAIIS
ncbi:MAG TPA: BPSS1780 family membrane protein, partial [Ignavibacteriaceae bacterium]